MRPVLVRVAGLEIPTHDFFVALGLAAAIGVFVFEAKRRGRTDEKLVWVVLGSLITGGLFARISTGWQYLTAVQRPTLIGLWLEGGRSVLGGLAGAYVGVLITKRIVGYKSSTGDLFAPGVALGMSIGRIGCFLTEQVGTPTSLPWGITVTPQQAEAMPFCPACSLAVPMHPSFLYEIAFHLLAFVVLLRWRNRSFPEGASFKFYLLGYGVFRFSVEFVRGNPAMVGPLSGSQVFLLVTIPLLSGMVVRQWRTYKTVMA